MEELTEKYIKSVYRIWFDSELNMYAYDNLLGKRLTKDNFIIHVNGLFCLDVSEVSTKWMEEEADKILGNMRKVLKGYGVDLSYSGWNIVVPNNGIMGYEAAKKEFIKQLGECDTNFAGKYMERWFNDEVIAFSEKYMNKIF